jgi:hypothetical protein
MFDEKPRCVNTSGNNSQCNIQYESVTKISIDIPKADVGVPVDEFFGAGQFDTGHTECLTCGARWVYNLINGKVTYIERLPVTTLHHQAQKQEGDGGCADCEP